MTTTARGLARPKITPEIVHAIVKTLREAEPFYRKRGLGEGEVESLYAAGYNLYSAGQYKEAADIFRLLCTYEHRDPRNWMALGGSLQHINNPYSAHAAFAMAAILEPSNPEPRMHAADSCIAMKDFDAARQCAEAVITLCGTRSEYASLKQRAESLREALSTHMAN